jgi:hypothetical protein
LQFTQPASITINKIIDNNLITNFNTSNYNSINNCKYTGLFLKQFENLKHNQNYCNALNYIINDALKGNYYTKHLSKYIKNPITDLFSPDLIRNTYAELLKITKFHDTKYNLEMKDILLFYPLISILCSKYITLSVVKEKEHLCIN